MSEQNSNQQPATQGTQQGSLAGQLASFMGAAPSHVQSIEQQSAPSSAQQHSAQPAQQQPALPAQPATPAAATPASPQSTPASVEPPAPAQPTVIKTALGDILLNTPAATPAAAPVKVETFEQVIASEQFKSTFGMEVSSPQEVMEKILPAAQAWRATAAKAGEFENKYTTLQESFRALPEIAKEALLATSNAIATGDDSWKQYFNSSPALNFRDPVDKVADQALVDHYYPGKFTPEQLGDKENQAAQIAIESSRTQYTHDKGKRDQSIQDSVNKAAQQRTAVSASLQSSIDKINQHLPISQDPGRVSQIKEMMENGKWQSLLFNADGTWHEQAAANLALASYGVQTFDQLIKVVTNQATSKVNEDIVDRSGAVRVNGSGAGNLENTQQNQNANALAAFMSPERPHFG